MGRVLLVEDEPVLRASMARGLGKLPGVEVLEAGAVDEALAVIDATPPDFIISDIDLPRRSGLELVGELKRRHLDTPLLFVSAYLKAYRPQVPPNANVEILEKPVPLEELRARVLHQLKEPKRTRAPFAVTDYVQLACMGNHVAEIAVSWEPHGRGQVVVANGTIWSARDAEGTGLAAFRRIAFRTDAAVEVRGLEGPLGPRDVEEPWEMVLLESARLADEAARSRPRTTPAGGVPRVARTERRMARERDLGRGGEDAHASMRVRASSRCARRISYWPPDSPAAPACASSCATWCRPSSATSSRPPHSPSR